MAVKCPLCKRKCSNDNDFISHLEKVHKNDDCECGEQGGGKPVFKGMDRSEMENFEKILKEARSKISKVEEDMRMNSIQFGLKIGKKEVDKIPGPVKEKVRNVIMENEYLKGLIKAQDAQIKMMKKHIDKCIDSVGFQYVIKK